MAVGDRIKRVRQFRGLTQKELGKLVGFDEKTADIRIAQYESNTRKPKEELLIKIADALEVNFRSLYEPYNYAAEDVMFTLFDLDEHYRITIHDVPDEEYPDIKPFNLIIFCLMNCLKNGHYEKKNLPKELSASPNIWNGN